MYSNKKMNSRRTASVMKSQEMNMINNKNDLVQFDIYKWNPRAMLIIAQKEFDTKNYEKSAQFFNEFVNHFPENKLIDDIFLFQAGVAAYETSKHYNWSEKYLQKLMDLYPTSKHYLSAKLWLGMSYLRLGKKKKFFNVIEEFRKKYRNTPEWSILSGHYEKIVQGYKSI